MILKSGIFEEASGIGLITFFEQWDKKQNKIDNYDDPDGLVIEPGDGKGKILIKDIELEKMDKKKKKKLKSEMEKLMTSQKNIAS